MGKGFTVLAVPAAIFGGWIGWSRWLVDHQRVLPAAVDAERRTFSGKRTGMLSYYLDAGADGRPLVLIHSVNAAASSYEMRPIFNRERGYRPVYALDLPGFGFSERSDREYTPRLFTDAIIDLLEEIGVKDGADLVALSLGSEFAARAAVERPDLVSSIALISPSGFGSREIGDPNPTAYKLLSAPLWSQAFYDLLVTGPSIKWFLQKSFVGPVDPGVASYALATSHQPGARYAPVNFVSGRLFTPGVIDSVYERVACPALVIYDQDGYVTFDRLPGLAARHPNWKLARIEPTKGLPQFERTAETVEELERFWATSDAISGAAIGS